MVLHNPNNWHWVNKDVSEWARAYLDTELTKIKAEDGDVSARITKVDSMEGDVDVSQRKGKVITLFDVKLRLDYEGDAPEAAGVMGTIAIPEVAHDTEEDEYVFEVELHSPEATKQPVKDLVRSALLPKLRTALAAFGPALMAEHGKAIQHAPGSGPSGSSTGPMTRTTSSSAAQSLAKPKTGAASSATSSSKGAPSVNTVPVKTAAEFRTAAAELYAAFTDRARLAAFTRSDPTVWEGARVGGKFALFGGGVQGVYTELQEPTKIVQDWRLQSWPQGHYSKLVIDFDQNDVDGVTNMRVAWDRVPVGEEESTQARFEEYYVRALKTTFGFGTIL